MMAKYVLVHSFSKFEGLVGKKGFENFFLKGYNHEGDVLVDGSSGLKGAVATKSSKY
jgi:hypothetical protein